MADDDKKSIDAPREKVETLNDVPVKWCRYLNKSPEDIHSLQISWAGSARGQATAIGGLLMVKFIAVRDDKRDMTFAQLTTSEGFAGSPDLLAGTLWSEVQDSFREARSVEGGKKLARMLGILECFDKNGDLIGEPERAYCHPVSQAEQDMVWMNDVDSEEERGTKALVHQLRREHRWAFGMMEASEIRSATVAAAHTEAIGMLATTIGKYFDQREHHMHETQQLYAQGGTGESVQEARGWEFFMMMMGKEKNARAEQPNAQGVDELVADCRRVSKLFDAKKWERLFAVEKKLVTLRDALDASNRFDATRADVREKMLGFYAALEQMRPQPKEVDAAIGSELAAEVAGLDKHFKEEREAGEKFAQQAAGATAGAA